METNFKTRQGEVDIIAGYGDVLVFCEVKARKRGATAHPREAVNAAKQEKIAKAALEYFSALHNADAPAQHRAGQLRFDVLEIIYDENGHELLHLKNAFAPQGGQYAL
ncbi:MAG: YraN family protein [Eubacteriales bacterium]|nr:YraN family protein [Eubacteriales bacterium]